jgi:NADH-quinone oxidoreductase subunit J
MVLFLFVVMLLNLKKIDEKSNKMLKTLGIVAAGILVVFFLAIVSQVKTIGGAAEQLTTTSWLGEVLFTQYLVPFEAAGILLLAAIIGALVLVKKRSA